MQENYQAKEIEAKWQEQWERSSVYRAAEDPDRAKYYLLEMFPYPSGRIHMGHVRNYTIGDVIARYKRMKGYNVLHPMGWDAFGMPAENAAIKHGLHPADWTRDNIAYMRKQLKSLGLSYDWEREIATCDTEYYRWEQKIFLEMYRKGLAYKKLSPVNWCPHCQTVLANEQVGNGKCWRCESQVETRQMEQWFLRITAYAQDLLDGSDKLDGWPERVLTMQRNWIDINYGCEIEFPVESGKAVNVFTTRPDTLYGVSFLSLAADHPQADSFVTDSERARVEQFRAQLRSETKERGAPKTKEGVFTGGFCLHPLTGEKVPVYLANFVLLEYGTGAVMAVPAHDQRDYEFAQKYSLPVKQVIAPSLQQTSPFNEAYTGEGVLVNSGQFSGQTSESAREAIPGLLEEKGFGRKTRTIRLRDWGISRQRYWGNPIPIIHCELCGVVPVPEHDLPVELPREAEFSGTGGNPLTKISEFTTCSCPQCGTMARRETDTMDTFLQSSWYFLRYCSPHYQEGPLDPEKVAYWMPVDQYIGGIEHAVLHLLYARFFTRVLKDLGYCSIDEPFTRLLTQGMVIKDGKKMSKSRGNVVDPDALVARYGADTARLFSLFAAPPEKDLEWEDDGVEGCYRFLNRVWRLAAELKPVCATKADPIAVGPGKELKRLVHRAVKKVSDDIEDSFHFNSAIAAIMELCNALQQFEQKSEPEHAGVLREALLMVVRLLAPFVPHFAAELWQSLGEAGPIEAAGWPEYDAAALVSESCTVVIQVNGRLRGKIEIGAGTSEEDVIAAAIVEERVAPYLAGQTIRKTIYVADKLVNFVIG